MSNNTNRAAEAAQPAATSGDAPADLQQLKALALAAKDWTPPEAWGEDRSYSDYEIAGLNFNAAASPAVVLDLIARIEHMTTVPEQAPSTEQEWAKVDPAVAFHLIERHAEDWADAGRMMEAWRAATVHIERAASPATASGDELPPLPEKDVHAGDEAFGDNVSAFSGAAMQQYARYAITASRRADAVEPVAWIRKTDITEWTDSEPETEGWTPLYATPAPASAGHAGQVALSEGMTNEQMIRRAIAELRALAPQELRQAGQVAKLADALNTMLWLYRRLPGAYGKPPFVDAALIDLAAIAGVGGVPEAIKERADWLAIHQPSAQVKP